LLAVHHLATIGLGMAAVTAVVSLMLAMAFQSLPFRESAQLVQVWHRVESGTPMEGLSGTDLIEIQEGAGGVFSSFGGYLNILLWARDEARSTGPLAAVRMEEAAFRALDLTPILGRPIDGRTSSGLTPVWIGHNLWQSRYGGRSSVIGQTIRLASNDAGRNESSYEIAGVLPPDIRIPFPTAFFDNPIDVWQVLPDDLKVRFADNRSFLALGRLQPGRTAAEAEAALMVLADRRPRTIDRRHRPVVQSFEEIAAGPVRRTIGILAVGIALVLLLAFANLASLTVAEGTRRRLELSVRTSLGATRWQLWRDLAAEHIALTVSALGLGLPLAWAALRGLTRLVTVADIGLPLPQPPSVNVYVIVGFAVCALALAFVWATLIVRDVQPGDSRAYLQSEYLSGAARLSTADRHAKVLRLGVLSIQSCLGIALMVLAVSMAKVYERLTEVDLGPAPDRTMFFSVHSASGGTPTSAQAADFILQVRSLLQNLPDVQAMAVADIFPPRGSAISFWRYGDDAKSPRETTYPVTVSHDYFSTLGIPILFGRAFDESDRFAGKSVAVIDLEMARRNWASPAEAVNAQIKIGTWGTYEVIGVAGSFGGYWAQAPTPTVYLSQNQAPRSRNVVILRTDSPASNIAEHARQVLRGMPVRVEMSAATTLQARWQETATRPRARMVGMLLLALIGVGLGIQGVYALSASNVAARQQELAIRTALGASPSALVWLVLRPLIVAVMIGSSVGVAAIFSMSRLAPHWISAAVSEPASSIAVALAVLLMTAVSSGYIPARSATRVTSGAWLRR
jgi:putative ABC transport system permease protein